MDKINAYTEEFLEYEEENGGMSAAEAGFSRGYNFMEDEAELAEEEL